MSLNTAVFSEVQQVPEKETVLETRQAMDAFLAGIEKRAFQMARLAIGDPDEALDLVQDAMIKLVRSYANRPADEWQPLFFRILKNRIIDHQRRGNVRRRVMVWFGGKAEDDDYLDPVARAPGPATEEPDRQVSNTESMAALERAVKTLPERQQQAFLLRTVQELDVKETAKIMGCSEGSVKTHLSRALAKLREELEACR